jgi:hypothetical protein
MERVAFLIEETNERLGCLLNPESLVIRRVAGVQPRRSATGQFTGAGLTDDPLLYTGGGQTVLELDLLFDVSLAGSSINTDDVRDLTDPLWNLAENVVWRDGYGRPPLVRFIWGKSWNIPGVIVAVAGRLEHFTPAGVPRRSWLRMRLLRVDEGERLPQTPGEQGMPDGVAASLEYLQESLDVSADRVHVHEIVGGVQGAESLGQVVGEEAGQVIGGETGQVIGEERGGGLGAGERLDEIAYRFYGNPALWRLIAIFNDIIDPLRIAAGSLLRVPLLPVGRGRRE